jgi:hypothetical protein
MRLKELFQQMLDVQWSDGARRVRPTYPHVDTYFKQEYRRALDALVLRLKAASVPPEDPVFGLLEELRL